MRIRQGCTEGKHLGVRQSSARMRIELTVLTGPELTLAHPYIIEFLLIPAV